GWPSGTRTGADDTLRASICRGFDHRAVGTDIGEHHVDAPQGLPRAHVELAARGMFAHGLMVVDDFAVPVGVTEGPEIAGLKCFHPIGSIFGHIPTVEDRVVHYQQAA